jgi:HK97 family phage major capsid protein
MLTLQERYAKSNQIAARMEELAAKDSLTPDEQAEFDRLDQEFQDNEAAIKRMESADNAKKTVNQPENKGKRPCAEPKDHKGGPYNTLAEQIYDIIQAGKPGGVVSEKLMQVQNAATGGSSGVPSEGGFLVQPTFAPGLIETAIEQDDLLSKCTPIEVGENSDRAEVIMVQDRNRGTGYRWGGVRVYRRAEADTVSAFKADDFKTWECKLEDIMALSYLTERQMQDIPQLASMIRNNVPKEIAFTLNEEMFTGNGVGHMLGILKCASLVQVPIESGQTLANGPVLAKNIANMWARVPKENRKNALWLYNQELEPEFDSLNIHVGTGGQLVYMPAGGISGAGYGSFKGRPAIPFEHCEAPGTLGDFMIVDPTDYVLVRKGQLMEAESIHVRFVYAERCLRWILRINGKPKYTEKIVPFKGTKERSSFVALAARS